MEEISKIRKNIDQIDKKIVELLDERAECVKKIGEYKKQHNIPIYQPEREKQVKELVLATSKNIFPR